MSEDKEIKKIIGKTFMEIADAIKTGNFGERIKIGLTTLGSEHGIETLVKGAQMVAKQEDMEKKCF